jgi:hypothetical protein
MKTEINEEFKSFNIALSWAKKRGYIIPPMEYAVLYKARDMGKTWSMRVWAQGLLFDEEFARYFFGEKLMYRERFDMGAIRLWAKQFAVEYQGNYYKAQTDSPFMAFLEYDDLSYWEDKAPTEIVHARKVVRELTRMAASIPFMTHHIEDVQVDDVTPGILAYEYHLEKMATSGNPFRYIQSFMDDKKDPDCYE